MTAQGVNQLAGEHGEWGCYAHIEHNPLTGFTVLTGTLDGKAFYEPIARRTFDVLVRKQIAFLAKDDKPGNALKRYVFKGKEHKLNVASQPSIRKGKNYEENNAE
jgi:hypothetical protein